MKKKTKIVATISDQKCDVEFIREMFEAGMNVVRLNTAHQTIDDTLRIVNNVRQVSDKIALLLDTKGPEIRTNPTSKKIEVKTGNIVKLKGDRSKPSDEEFIYVDHPGFLNDVSVDDHIMIDDGDIDLLVTGKDSDHLTCKVLNNGIVKGRKSVNVPNVVFSLPALSEKDKEYIKFAIEQDIDFIAHSFVRSRKDITEIRRMLDAKKSKVKIIAKIENQEGVDNIDEILEEVYGIMVARGDLAIEIPYEKIPGIQKKIINKCINARKPVIIATQMLHSMIENPRPTRAEVTDIANAIYSMTDAIMLSGETAYGNYPVEAVQTMARIALEVEKSRGEYHKTSMTVISSKISAYLTKSAVEASIKLNARVIIADTATGRTVRNIAGFRGKKPVYAQCYNNRVVRELALSFGVFPNFLDDEESKDFMKSSLTKLLEKNRLGHEDIVVVLGGNFGRNYGASFVEISTVENLLNE